MPTNISIRPLTADDISTLKKDANDRYQHIQDVVESKSKKPADLNIPVCYGYTQTEGVKLFDTIGNSNNVLESVYILSEGPIEGLTGISINGYGLDLKAIAAESGDSSVQSGTIYEIRSTSSSQQNLPFNGAFSFEFVNGGTSTILGQNTNLKETVNLQNVAYVVVRLIKTVTNTIWDDDGDPTLSFRVLGKKIPPIGNKAGTLAYSNNPARIMYDYLTNATYGKGLADSYFDSTSFTAAETYFDTTANIIRFEADMKQFQMDGVVDTSRNFIDNLKSMLQCFLCNLPYVNSKFYLNVERPIVNDPADIAYTFTDDNIVGDIGIGYSGTKDKWNNLKMQIRDRNAFYSTQTYSYPDENGLYSVYVTQDGQSRLEKSVTLPFIENAHMALNVGQIMTQKQRAKYDLTWTAKADAYQVRAGDLVEITNSRAGLSSQRVRVTKTTFNVNNFTVRFEGFAHSDDYYSYDTGRLKFLYPIQKRPNLPGPVPPEEPPQIFDPPVSPTLPDPGDPGGPGVTPPDLGQPTPGETYTYNFAGISETMSDNDRYYLGEFDYTNESTGERTDRFDNTGAQCHMTHFTTSSGNPYRYNTNQLLSGLTSQICIFDRNFDATQGNEELYFVVEWSAGRYGFTSGNTSIGTHNYDPETDGGFYTKQKSTGGQTDPQGVLGQSYFLRLRLWPDGRGNYSTKFSPEQGIFPRSSASTPTSANMPLLFPEPTFDPFGIATFAEMATIISSQGTLGIKVWKIGRFDQPNYVGQFDINFGLTSITAPEVLAESRKQYRFMASGGPGFPRGNPNDTTITPPF